MDGLIRKNTEKNTLEVDWSSLKPHPISTELVSDVAICDDELWKRFKGNRKLEELHVAVKGSGANSVLVRGPSGCGKSSLLREYASICGLTDGDTFMVVHLGEQIDGKMLLGTFTCTAVPGEFAWLPGLLTKCVLAGHWIVLEDIDCAPPDVVSLLLPLVKSRRLSLPGYDEPLLAATGFKLFLTQRLSSTGHLDGGSGLLRVLESHSITITLPPFCTDEMQKIVTRHFPSLESFGQQLARVVTEHNMLFRHVLKLCCRISQQVVNGQLTSIPDMMLDVLDCFVGHHFGEKRLACALRLSYLCGGLSHNMVEQLCTSHKPSVQISATTVAVGRAYLHCTRTAYPKVCYSHTQSSLSLLESVCRCVQMSEPVLLVGETGVGKTATVNYLADITGNKLVVVNMSQQTDSTDLLGGYKPLQMIHIVTPLKEEFEQLFRATFSLKQNARFLASVQTCMARQQWKKLLKLMLHSLDSAQKRTKDDNINLHTRWKNFGQKLRRLRQQIVKDQAFAFAFDKGVLMEAVSEGWWILLDEVNLASAETLQCLCGLLETDNTPLLFMERVFTELFVDEPCSTSDLKVMINDYLKSESPATVLVDRIVRLYRSLKELAETKLLDGTGRKPHYSLRNLCRALQYAASHMCGSFQKSLYEGFCMSFLTELSQEHHHTVRVEVVRCLALPDATITSVPSAPSAGSGSVVQVAGFWLACGSEDPVTSSDYVITPSVKRNLHNLARVVSARRYPVLLQGPTSAGKTSLVQYLARATGHHCLRINNHEHTDLQEYIGMYTANCHGELVFQEGVLVEAMRKGYWVILDELNLAPTDVLEALNRVLDDNRELFIPETREVVKAHPHFILFGTQNPPGIYGGRKVLSRAFRNRFIELHYDDIPAGELVIILQEKCQLPASYAKKMVAVMKELQERRTSSSVFAGKYGLITLRDLFRWAERYRQSPTTTHQFRDWEQQLAEDGFMLLAGRLRDSSDEKVVMEVVQKHFKRTVYPHQLFGQDGGQGSITSHKCLSLLQMTLPEGFNHLVWTEELLRMAVLAYRAISFNEPVLLVGNTGCGKTTLCQLFSSLLGRDLLSINCHMHTEAADFLGGLKPTRNRSECDSGGNTGLFEWQDGVVVKAMQAGCCLLVDEISLAEDAVLERLNSVLERERKLLVSERSRSEGQTEVFQITATDGFVFMATMNPGGDYGKKELSPALRNRFVEIWCRNTSEDKDLCKIIQHNLKPSLHSGLLWSSHMLSFLNWIKRNVGSSCEFSVRDLLSWVRFMNTTCPPLSPTEGFYHGAYLAFLDGLGCNGKMSSVDRNGALAAAEAFLQDLLLQSGCEVIPQYSTEDTVSDEEQFGIRPFFIRKGPHAYQQLLTYSLRAPGPHANAYRLLRGLQVGKPLLIEGPPGVGKTSLVTALAQASGHRLKRINLSEQTDISDLFGCDLPVEGGKSVRFAWRDGPLLRALRNGDWVLLDEINLASQSVLEGLNAVLDHRGEVFIPELGMVFAVLPGTRLFACQNPISQGGGRKGLPKSFLNRFTMVYVDMLSAADLLFVAQSLYPNISSNILDNMIAYNSKVETLIREECGSSLWEFNLRDILRWCQLMQTYQVSDPGQFVDLIYCRRLRSAGLRQQVIAAYCEVFGDSQPLPSTLGSYFNISDQHLQVGRSIMSRQFYHMSGGCGDPLLSLNCQRPLLEAVMLCLERGWMTILVGGGSSGKKSIALSLAQLTGHKLVEFPMNSDTDTTELLGGFQQVNFSRHYSNVANMVVEMCEGLIVSLSLHKVGSDCICDLVTMKNAHLPDLSSILQDSSREEVLLDCVRLKECLMKLNDTSSTYNIPLCYDPDEILLKINNIVIMIQEDNSAGQFEWVDSVLVTAVRYGHWVCISNANFCNASVLDRLNPLMEPGGVLHIDERGIVGDGVVAVTPHPDFRIFLLMDPMHGEISRAMRNRGIEICLLPEDTLGAVSHHKEDWRSLLSVADLSHRQASQLIDSCSNNTNVSPLKLLLTLHCNKFVSPFQEPSWKYLDVHHLLPLMSDIESCVSPLPILLRDLCTQPDLMMALSQFSAVTFAYNQHISSVDCGRDLPLKLRAALQVFTDHATLGDYHVRASLLAELATLCGNDTLSSNIAGEVMASSSSLDMYSQRHSQLTVQRGNVVFDLNSLVASTNPVITSLPTSQLNTVILESSRIILAGRINSLKELVKWCSECCHSALQDSRKAHTGQLQLDSLVHPCLLHIQPLFISLLDHLYTHIHQCTKPQMVEEVVEWVSVMVQCFSLPVVSLTHLAVWWTLTKSHCLSPLSLDTTHSVLGVHVSNLHELEAIVQHSHFISLVRDKLDLSTYSREESDPIAPCIQPEVRSAACFSVLSASSEESLCSIGGYQSKIDQLQNLLHSLWITGCSMYSGPLAHFQSKLKGASNILDSTLASLSSAVQQWDSTTQSSENQTSSSSCNAKSPESVSELLHKAEILCPAYNASFWERLGSEVAAAHQEIATIKRSLEADNSTIYRDQRHELEMLSGLSRVCVHVGVVMSQLLLPTDVDPVSMAEIEYNCYQLLASHQCAVAEACDRHYLLTTGRSLAQLTTIQSSNHSPPGFRGGVAPYVKWVLSRREVCEESLNCIHPPASSSRDRRKYTNLVSVCHDLIHTLCSPNRVSNLLQDASTASSLSLLRVQAWKNAVNAALEKLHHEEFSSFSDVLLPFSVGLQEILSGICGLASLQSSLTSPNFHLLPAIRDLAQFPFFCVDKGSGSAPFVQMLLNSINVVTNNMTGPVKQQFHKKMLMVAVRSCYKYISSTISNIGASHISEKWLTLCGSVVEQCWSLWDTAEQTKRAKAAEEDSLYCYRTKTHIVSDDDEGVEEGAVRQIFPVYDCEFESSKEERGLEMKEESEPRRDGDVVCQLSSEEMEEISNLHQLLFTHRESKQQSSTFLCSKYSLAASLADIISRIPGLSTDYCLFGGHAQMCKMLLTQYIQPTSGRECSNMYKEAMVCEAMRAGPVVSHLKIRVEELLLEWPEHPGLIQIVKSCDKVLSLSVREPLMKILAGLEYILRRAQDWEAYAASHVSLSSQLEALTQIILDWRRLELNSWNSLLSLCTAEVQSKCSKWWFYIQSLCQEFVTNGEANTEELLMTIHGFVENASLGEFSDRLNILRAFSVHMWLKGHSVLGNILNNTVRYYQQFLTAVLSHSDKLTAPVEKEFKEQVSIMRWNDCNYWALKASTEKNHRTLFNFMKKWKAALEQPVRPLLTADILNTCSQEYEGKEEEMNTVIEKIFKKLSSFTTFVELHFTEDQVKFLSHVVVKELIDTSEDVPVQLTARSVSLRMSELLKDFSSSTVYHQWNITVGILVGEVIDTMNQLHSQEFLKGLEADKRKSAIKLNSNQKRNAIVKLFKCLKKQGLSYRSEMDFSTNTKCAIFQLPVVHNYTLLNIPKELEIDIQKYFYCCISRLAGLQAAFVSPTKDLPASQLKQCKGYAGYLVGLVCKQRETLALASGHVQVLQHTVKVVKSLVNWEVSTLQTTGYAKWQSTLLAGVEMSLELVSDYAELVATMPDQVDITATTNLPPILACGDNSIAKAALTILEADVPKLRVLYCHLVEMEKDRTFNHCYFVTKNDILGLTDACDVLEKFTLRISEVLNVTLGTGQNRVAMLEFLEAAHSHLTTICQQCRRWIQSVAKATSGSGQAVGSGSISKRGEGDRARGEGDRTRFTDLLGELLMSVQRVMVRHRECTAITEENREDLLEFPCCLQLHLSATRNLTDMNSQKVIEQLQGILQFIVKNPSEAVAEELLPVLALLHHYTAVLHMLVLNLAVAHRTLCKLLSVLLALFSDLVAKGLCIPPEVVEDGEGGTEFVDAEGGGFDEGQGTKNVSNEVEAEDLENPTQKEGETEDTVEDKREEGDEDAVDMTEEFGGEVEDLPGREEDEESSQEEEEGDEDYEKEMGDLGQGNSDQVDRNMWAPEDEEEQKELREVEEHGEGSAEKEEARIVAKDEQGKQSQANRSEPHQHPSGEEVDEGIEKEEKEDVPIQEDEETGQNNPAELEQMEQEQENDDPGFDMDNLNMSERGEESGMSSGDEECGEGMEQEDEEEMEDGEPDHVEAPLPEEDLNNQAEVTDGQSMESSSKYGTEAASSDDHLPSNSTQPDMQDSMDVELKNEKSDPSEQDAENGAPSTTSATTMKHSQEDRQQHQKLHPRPQEDYSLAAQEERALKKPRLMQDKEQQNSSSIPQTTEEAMAFEMFQHVKEEEREVHDAVVWGAAPLSHTPVHVPPSDHLDRESTVEQVEDATSTAEDQSMQDVDMYKRWQKYEALMSALSQSLCEELRLVLQPTQASQLRGDYRTGKRLNMRRIIPYIASYFQNDRIWLRRTKPNKRDYQILVAIDDSASMNENECNQMAYESLAMISSALSRLECGQLGIIRFGESAELLHGFEKPFSATAGAHVLQHLSFAQARTNFVELLQTANELFSQSLEARKGRSFPLISQLLVVLSDGRGVFADGTTPLEVAIRKLNELGVLTVFVILDSLSKDSVLNIKVPSFSPGKAPVIRSYLETFPFPFYIVLQDIKSLPLVLSKALQQWFELLSGQ